MPKRNPTEAYNPPTLKPDDLGGDKSPAIDTVDDSIQVELVNVDAHVLNGVLLNDIVSLQFDSSPMRVTTLSGLRIGDIALADEQEVKNVGNKVGRVVEVERGALKCVIHIARKR